MENQELLEELSAKIASGAIAREDVLAHLGSMPVKEPGPEYGFLKEDGHFSLSKVLYILGSAVVILGIVFLVGQLWDDIGSLGRILVTFGLGIMFAGIGSFLFASKPESHLGQVFHGIGGMLVPGGALVMLYELGGKNPDIWPVTFTIGTVFLFYLLLASYHKNAILTFFAFANGTAFMYLLFAAILDNTLYFPDDIYAYLTMVIGASYLLFGQSFKGTWNSYLTGPLNFLGSAGFLAGAFSRVFDSVFWQIIFFALAAGALVLAIRVRSRSILVVGTLFLIGHFGYITGEYFADSIGWPISLVILGLLFIGLGYVSISINKKYIGTAK
ncbi:MAG: hypothetical protein COU90_04255 [Candidatus Ryanbacteria bacterium CG10_big_fil_rev_8_21_14_0_10_43_42]|uniref:DUF2157 domain-containing protein n=1 Tax=Candidatus Ryanbacteria bacterium CG10_big_fil_rev_8_21_14_0_10_43_42 TaxID=1974864 RepID=A0A2M8KVU5_9BACT|nr:MAG: hypothetical protein COU90_04255 [Candidatus Ryanbacteria bacterium CG10_big_fil_rev_8_21_14_0_10_43_42]